MNVRAVSSDDLAMGSRLALPCRYEGRNLTLKLLGRNRCASPLPGTQTFLFLLHAG